MSKPDGGPAFATGAVGTPYQGMSLRDYFAAQAMIGLLGGPGMPHINSVAEARGIDPVEAAAIAVYDYADAMIAERERARE